MSDYSYQTRLFLEDECPQLGSGWRVVTVDDDIDVTTLTDHMGRKCRLPTAKFDQLVEASEQLAERCKA